jgi:hypothetical protein
MAYEKEIQEKKDRKAWAERELETLRTDLVKVDRRLAELEPPVDFKLNDTVIHVKLTQRGLEVARDHFKMDPLVMPNGYTEFYLSHFMRVFGRYMDNCSTPVIEGSIKFAQRNYDKLHSEDFRSSSELRMLRGNIHRGIAYMEREIRGAQDGIEYFQEQ